MAGRGGACECDRRAAEVNQSGRERPVLKRTSAEEIRRSLAERIITGELAPGLALDETLLAAEFGVSRTPVREALRLLAASGLVDQKPHAKALVFGHGDGREPGAERLEIAHHLEHAGQFLLVRLGDERLG
ncbi:MAG: GntR family transcriptional regulator, partial [Hyphomicrobiales bacterium]